MNVSFLFTWGQTSLPFDFLSVLVVQGAVYLPTPPSWFSESLDLDVVHGNLLQVPRRSDFLDSGARAHGLRLK